MNVSILGCGRWASFHAWYHAKKLKNRVLVWGRDTDSMYLDLAKTRKNEYLTLPASVKFTSDLKHAVDFADYIIISISAQAMPEFSAKVAELEPQGKTFVLCMKGIIDETGERLSEVMEKALNTPSSSLRSDDTPLQQRGINDIVVWVGPGHAQELSKGLPNVMVVSGENPRAVNDVVTKFKSDLVKLYESTDLIGCEIGAAAKNVLGITAGILDGAGLSSLKGALMARGVYEVSRLIVAMGGQQLTAYGISHIGDFEATLFSQNSNNRRYGENLMKKVKSTYLAEGVATAKALKLLAAKYNVEMPISEVCYKVVHEGKDPLEGLKELFLRDNLKEFRG